MFRDSGISSEICDQADHDAKNKPRSPRPGNGSGALSFALTRTPHDSKSLTGLRGREQKHGRGRLDAGLGVRFWFPAFEQLPKL